MNKQKGFSLIGVLLIIGVLLTAGRVVVWRKKVFPTTPVPTSTPTGGRPMSCRSDADCPSINWFAPCNGHCPRYYCQRGKCVLLTPTPAVSQSRSLNEKIKLNPSQRVNITGTDLFLTLLKIGIPGPDQPACCPDVRFDCPVLSHECPVIIKVEARSGIRKEVITFQLPGFGTLESRETPWRNKEVFGFRIRIEEESSELIILTVKKL